MVFQKRLKLNVVSILLSVIMLIVHCVNLSDTITTNTTEFTPEETDEIKYQLFKRYFVLVPGDTAFLCGTRTCSTFVNGQYYSCLVESAYVQTITKQKESISFNDTEHYVFPQIYQHGTSISKLSHSAVTHYFTITDTGVLQPAYQFNNIIYYPKTERRVVIYKPVEVGFYPDSLQSKRNCWPASPLFHIPKVLPQDIVFEGQNVATKVYALSDSSLSYWVNNVGFRDGIQVKTYHPINYEYLHDTGPVRVLGTTTCERAYFKDMGLIDQKLTTIIQKFYANDDIEVVKEIEYVGRPNGATLYPDIIDTVSYN